MHIRSRQELDEIARSIGAQAHALGTHVQAMRRILRAVGHAATVLTLWAADVALRSVPVHDVKTATPGTLYRRGLLLHAEQDSLDTHTLDSSRGPLAASAYNYRIRRFAAFFAMRRALLMGVEELTPDLIGALAKNDDPCLQPYKKPGMRAKP